MKTEKVLARAKERYGLKLTKKQLKEHKGHELSLVKYGNQNISLECEDCYEVLCDKEV